MMENSGACLEPGFVGALVGNRGSDTVKVCVCFVFICIDFALLNLKGCLLNVIWCYKIINCHVVTRWWGYM